MRKLTYLLSFLLIALIFSCKKKSNPINPTHPSNPADSILKLTGVKIQGLHDLKGPISDKSGNQYIYGFKDNSAWFGVINSNKLVFSKHYENSPQSVDVGYGEKEAIKTIFIKPGAETAKAFVFVRLIANDLKSRVGFLGQTVYDKASRTIKSDSLYKFNYEDKDNDFPLLYTYIKSFNKSILTFGIYDSTFYLMNEMFEIQETIKNKNKNNFLLRTTLILKWLSKNEFITYEKQKDEIHVLKKELRQNKIDWNTTLFRGLQPKFKIDSISTTISGSIMTVDVNILNKDGTKEKLNGKINLNTGETID